MSRHPIKTANQSWYRAQLNAVPEKPPVMVEVETAELSRAALDYAVARAINRPCTRIRVSGSTAHKIVEVEGKSGTSYSYSVTWQEAAVLLAQHLDSVSRTDDGWWQATMFAGPGKPRVSAIGPSVPYAVGRCIVMGFLGEKLNIPELLIGDIGKMPQGPMDETDIMAADSQTGETGKVTAFQNVN